MVGYKISNIFNANKLIIKNLTNGSVRAVLPEKQGLRPLDCGDGNPTIGKCQSDTSIKQRLRPFVCMKE